MLEQLIQLDTTAATENTRQTVEIQEKMQADRAALTAAERRLKLEQQLQELTRQQAELTPKQAAAADRLNQCAAQAEETKPLTARLALLQAQLPKYDRLTKEQQILAEVRQQAAQQTAAYTAAGEAAEKPARNKPVWNSGGRNCKGRPPGWNRPRLPVHRLGKR